MKDQPLDLNHTWTVGRKWCWFTNAPNFLGPSPKNWGEKHQILDHLFVTSALDTAYLRNETSRQQTKMLVSIYNVSPKVNQLSVTFDPETADNRLLIVIHHYVASIKVWFCSCGISMFASALWRYWLGGRKSIQCIQNLL